MKSPHLITNDYTRRRFINETALGISCFSLVGFLGLGVNQKSQAKVATFFRPPGALPEKEFLNACVRCGLCVRDCPYDTLKLANLAYNTASGTPIFEARKIPCEMCEDLPCVVACPTGALNHQLTDITKAKMGVAVLLDQETCIAFAGLRCEVCFNVCPVRDKAITIEKQHNVQTNKHAKFIPTVHSEHCTGCGKCEYACILPEPAIKVLPTSLAKGKSGEHYLFGLDEKKKYGSKQSVFDHKYTLPDNLEYDYSKDGLRQKESLHNSASKENK